MTLMQAAVYGAVQGLTEFLPVSSSAHLNLLPWLLRWEDPGLSFDVALHVGTLVALLGYFWKDWTGLILGTIRDPRSAQARLLAFLALATIPGGLAGLLFQHYAETLLRAAPITAAALILFGLLLGWAERHGAKTDSMEALDLKRALLIGASQALAIIPGVSRSGITITAGLLAGLTPEAATRFSFLLSTPIILGAALHEFHKAHATFLGAPALIGMGVSAVTGLFAIHFLLACMRSWGFKPFVWYRVALGGAILAVSFLR
jgi:undecaprenyl-diphosphatase